MNELFLSGWADRQVLSYSPAEAVADSLYLAEAVDDSLYLVEAVRAVPERQQKSGCFPGYTPLELAPMSVTRFIARAG